MKLKDLNMKVYVVLPYCHTPLPNCLKQTKNITYLIYRFTSNRDPVTASDAAMIDSKFISILML